MRQKVFVVAINVILNGVYVGFIRDHYFFSGGCSGAGGGPTRSSSSATGGWSSGC